MKQSIFYPFAFMSKYGRGVVLKPVTTAPKAESRYGETPLLQQSVVYNEQEKAVNVFALNIGNEEMKLDLDLRSFGKVTMQEHICMAGDLMAQNTFGQPNTVSPKDLPVETGRFSTCSTILQPQSYHVLRFSL